MKIFITGGTGSLGKALLHFFQHEGHHDLTVYSRDEVKQTDLKREFPFVNFMLGDVRDYDRLYMAMRGHDTIIHAAAYKQVPSSEANVDEAIATNVIGSLNVARAAIWNNAAYVVGISTDKACQPVNAYGATKSLMEKLFQQANEWTDSTIFNLVRYGNVLDSRGSVVPLFRKQLREGRVTMTDPYMTRFWMTIEQAVNLVWDALDPMSRAQDGAIIVPQARASTMATLLEAVAEVENAARDWPYTVEVIGARAGEKKHEQLIHENESLHTLQPFHDYPHYQIMPATDLSRVPRVPFEYRSDMAPQLTIEELVEMLSTDVPRD